MAPARRKGLASEQKVPAYVVFDDRTLREMVIRKPGSAAALLDVNGVGPARLERYGPVFLDAIREYA